MAAAAICLPREDELWSGSRETLEQRMEYFLENETLADMTFLVGDDRRRIPGHKFILSSCSWDFYNALHLLRIDNDELLIQDVPYESFLNFLRYCYTGILDLKPENAINILKLAYRFEMKPLIKKCETQMVNRGMIKMINSKSCLTLFTQCEFLPKDSSIKNRILDEIIANFLYIVENESIMEIFKNLSLKAVEEIADLRLLNVLCKVEEVEVKLFEALMKWSTRACQKAEIDPTPQNLREALAHVFEKIRFSTMKSEDFMKIVAKYPTMFTLIEVINIAKKQTGTIIDIDESSIFPNIDRNFDSHGLPYLLSQTRDVASPLIDSSTLSTVKMIQINHFWVGFRVKSPKKLLGFAFILKKDQEVALPSSCDFHTKCSTCREDFFMMDPIRREYYEKYNKGYNNCTTREKMTVTLNLQQKLSSLHSVKDYCVFSMFLCVEQNLEPSKFYKLNCIFKDKIYTPDIVKPAKSSGLEAVEFYSEGSPIQFLYFAK